MTSLFEHIEGLHKNSSSPTKGIIDKSLMDSFDNKDYALWGPPSVDFNFMNEDDLGNDINHLQREKRTRPPSNQSLNTEERSLSLEINQSTRVEEITTTLPNQKSVHFSQTEEMLKQTDDKDERMSSSSELLFDEDDDYLELYLPENGAKPCENETNRDTHESEQQEISKNNNDDMNTVNLIDSQHQGKNFQSECVEQKDGENCPSSKNEDSITPDKDIFATNSDDREIRVKSFEIEGIEEVGNFLSKSEILKSAAVGAEKEMCNVHEENEQSIINMTELSILASNSSFVSCNETSDNREVSTSDCPKTSDFQKTSPVSAGRDNDDDVPEISILASEASFLSVDECDIAMFSTPKQTCIGSRPSSINTQFREECPRDAIGTQDKHGLILRNVEQCIGLSDKREDHNECPASEMKESANKEKNSVIEDKAISLSSFNDCDDNNFDERPHSPILCISEYLLTIDDAQCLLRSCATASTCSSVSDLGAECSEEIADIIANASLSSDSSFSHDDDDDVDEAEDDEYFSSCSLTPNVKDIHLKLDIDDNLPTENSSCCNSSRGKKRERQSNVQNNCASSVSSDIIVQRNRGNGRSNMQSRHSAFELTSKSYWSPYNSHGIGRKRGIQAENSRTNRKLFDPYADQKFRKKWTPPTKRPWRPNPSYKRPETLEDWPALPEYQSPQKPDQDAKEQPPTYAEVLGTPKPIPKRNNSRDISSTSTSTDTIQPMESNCIYSPSSSDTDPPGRGELLISNSRNTVRFTDGTMSTDAGFRVGDMKPIRLDNRFQNLLTTGDFRDPAIIATSTDFHIRPLVPVPNHNRTRGPVGTISFQNDNLFNLFSRPNIQQEDPAILGVINVRQPVAVVTPQPMAISPDKASEVPTRVAKKNAMFDDPAIIYADRRPSPTKPLLIPASQTGFWSIQDSTPCSGNSFVDSDPFLRSSVNNTHSFSRTSQVQEWISKNQPLSVVSSSSIETGEGVFYNCPLFDYQSCGYA